MPFVFALPQVLLYVVVLAAAAGAVSTRRMCRCLHVTPTTFFWAGRSFARSLSESLTYPPSTSYFAASPPLLLLLLSNCLFHLLSAIVIPHLPPRVRCASLQPYYNVPSRPRLTTYVSTQIERIVLSVLRTLPLSAVLRALSRLHTSHVIRTQNDHHGTPACSGTPYYLSTALTRSPPSLPVAPQPARPFYTILLTPASGPVNLFFPCPFITKHHPRHRRKPASKTIFSRPHASGRPVLQPAHPSPACPFMFLSSA